MLTKFAAALLATSLIAGSALAAEPAATTGSNSGMPAAQTQAPAKPAATANKTGKTVRHSTRRHAHVWHVRKHIARGKSHNGNHAVHHARHAKPAKSHQVGIAKGTGRS
jgi:hypothetical protein